MNLSQFIEQLQSPTYIGIMVLMLSTFLIGYIAGLRLTSTKNRALIKRLKKEVNNLKISQQGINNIDVIYSEIKPRIIEIVKEAQKEKSESTTRSREDIAEKSRNGYVSYSPGGPSLDFDSFGFGDQKKRDRLTEINGIGPYIEEKLNDLGIYNFDQISKFQIKDIRAITTRIDFFPGRIEKDDWVGQAKALKLIHY